MAIMDRRPLPLVFALVLAGCGCPDPEERSEDVTLSDEEIAPFLTPAGDIDPAQCNALCEEYGDFNADSCELIERDPQFDKANRVECTGTFGTFCTGRRPRGLATADEVTGDDPVGRWLAEAAHLEAASIVAFEQLTTWLGDLGADASLVAQAQAAADDERRHARQMTALAHAHRVVPATVSCTVGPRPTRLTLAIDNAVEGCIRETWGALLAHHQAAHATSPTLRAAFATIATDETRHAELAHAIADWLVPQLDEETQRVVARAATAAIEQLRATAGRDGDALTHRRLGLPSRAVAMTLLDRMQRHLWSAAAAA